MKTKLKIAIDVGPLSSGHAVRGIGIYTRELLKALDLAGVDVSKADLDKYDVVHFTSFKPFEISLAFLKPRNAKFVLTIYDLIPLIYPSHYPSGVKGWINWQKNRYLIRKNVDAIITISETSKKDICRFLGVEPKKIFVTYLAPRSVFQKLKIDDWRLEIEKRFDLPSHFALYIGDVNYNKNIPNLVKACEIAGVPLVVVGKQAKEVENMDLNHPELRHLKEVNWEEVIRPGFVSDEDLAKIYNLAKVYIQPSFYEGFGLPLLEAYACGAPLVVSKNQCHVETLGNDFDYVDASDPKDMARGILHPNKDGKLTRIYSWEKTAKKTLSIYEKI